VIDCYEIYEMINKQFYIYFQKGFVISIVNKSPDFGQYVKDKGCLEKRLSILKKYN